MVAVDVEMYMTIGYCVAHTNWVLWGLNSDAQKHCALIICHSKTMANHHHIEYMYRYLL